MDLTAINIEANYAYCEQRRGDAEQRMAELATDIIGRREDNTIQLGEILQKYKKPVLDKMQLVKLELGKKENMEPKKQEELTKQLNVLNTELENAGKTNGRYEPAIQKLIDNDKALSSKATKAMAYSGNSYRESLQGDNEAANKSFTDTLQHGNQTYNDNGRWFLPSPLLRVIKKINPFSAN